MHRSLCEKCPYSKCPYAGSYFPAFRLNTERYSVSLGIQSEGGKMRTRITPNTDFSHAVLMNLTVSNTTKLLIIFHKTLLEYINFFYYLV